MQLSPKQRQQVFLQSKAAIEIREQLLSMESDPAFNTRSTYVPGLKADMSFADKHFAYISTHQYIKPQDYMSNLRLKTRLR